MARYEISSRGQTTAPKPETAKFFPMQLQGAGTPHVEAVTSYVCRLIALHGITLRLFAITVKRLSGDSLFTKLRGRFSSTGTLNGAGAAAEHVVTVLSLMTDIDVATGTMLQLRPYLPPRRGTVIRSERCWCSLCYQEDIDKGRPIHDRLIWYIRGVEFCAIHGIRLESRCGQCGQTQEFIPKSVVLGQCYSCGGSFAATTLGGSTWENGAISAWQMWYLDACTNLITWKPAARQTEGEVVRKLLATAQDCYGSVPKLAKVLYRNEATVAQWLRGRSKPHFLNIMEICACLGVYPDAALDSPEVLQPYLFDDDLRMMIPGVRRKCNYTKRDGVALRALVQTLISKIPEGEVFTRDSLEKEIGVPQGSLNYYCSDLLKGLTARNYSIIRARRQNVRTKNMQIVSDAVDQLGKTLSSVTREAVVEEAMAKGASSKRQVKAAFTEVIRKPMRS